MNALQKGLLLGVVQIALVTSLAAKLSWDRHRFPRTWAKAGTWDPDLPIRGRYLGLQLEIVCDNTAAMPPPQAPRLQSAPPVFNPPVYLRGKLRVENGHLASDCASINEAANEDSVPMLRQQRRGQSAMTTMLSAAAAHEPGSCPICGIRPKGKMKQGAPLPSGLPQRRERTACVVSGSAGISTPREMAASRSSLRNLRTR